MQFTRRTAQLLHEDHRATIEVIEGLDALIARFRRHLPDTSDPAIRRPLEAALGAVENEIGKHFAFEENELFVRLEAMGDVGIGAHLRSEHAALLPLGHSLADKARAALRDGFDEAGWNAFRNVAAQLVERMFAHIQKEEMALLPALEDILDAGDDAKIAAAYSESRN